MTDSSPSPFSTPKRKRAGIADQDVPSPLHTQFSFDVNLSKSVPTSGSSSPRTKVAHRFRGLALNDYGGSGGGVIAADNDTRTATASDKMEVDEDELKMRKRTRISPIPPDASAAKFSRPVALAEIPETPEARTSQPYSAADPTAQEPPLAPTNDNSQTPQLNTTSQFVLDQALFTSSPRPSPAKLSRPFPTASNRHLEVLKPKGRKRAGTPPLVSTGAKGGGAEQPKDADAEIVDPIRAALTWHEDEITIYDPEDEDDDGVGINGIGFKPTPAIAYARTMKRRQQLAEYKKREEREARARRSLRRRGSPARSGHKLEREDSAGRKVRFTETEPSMMIETI